MLFKKLFQRKEFSSDEKGREEVGMEIKKKRRSTLSRRRREISGDGKASDELQTSFCHRGGQGGRHTLAVHLISGGTDKRQTWGNGRMVREWGLQRHYGP
jgi:hypothetical protein